MPPDPKDKRVSKKKSDPNKPFWPRQKRRSFEEHVLTHLHNLEINADKLRRLIVATAADLQAKVTRIGTAVDNIRADIQTIKDNLPSAGGMTQVEVDALDTQLAEVVTKTENLDAENPAP